MPSLDLRVLVLERWRRAWEDDWSQRSFVYGGGSGAVGRVALWQTASALTSDPELFYDSGTNRLGIGTTTVTAPLTFPATTEQKIHLFSSGTTRYGLGISSGALDIFAQTGGGVVRLGHMSIADGTTFTSAMGVTQTAVDCAVPLSVAWPAQANYELTTNRFYAAGVSRFNNSLVVAGILDAYSYSMIEQLRVGDHVAPGYALDVNGDAILRGHTGIGGYPPLPGVYHLNTGATQVTSLSATTFTSASANITAAAMITGPVRIGDQVYPGYGLDVNAQSMFRNFVGIYYAPDASYWLRCAAAKFDGIDVVNTLHANRLESTTWVTAAEASIGARVLCFRLGLAGGDPGTTYALYSAGGMHHFEGPLRATNIGIGADPGGYALYSAGAGSVYLAGTTGIGRGPSAGWGLCVTNMYADATIEGQNLTARGTVTVSGSVDAWSYCMMPSLRLGDHVAPGFILDVNGTAYMRSTLAVIGNTVVGPGYLQVAGNATYVDARYGIRAQSYADGGTFSAAYWLYGNPNWAEIRAELIHVHGTSAYLNIAAGGTHNYYQLHMSGVNAYIGLGAWVDAASDRRIKRGITPIDAPLARLAKLHGSHYERTDLPTVEGFPAPNPFEYGLVAQDVAAALPDAAFEHDYGEERGKLWNYYDRPILALLVESVKALAQRVEALEAH